jgi:hypothetical protein
MHEESRIIYDTNITNLDKQDVQRSQNQSAQPHPALIELARTLGRQAGRFFAENRFRALGAIELHRLQMEAKARRELNGGAV